MEYIQSYCQYELRQFRKMRNATVVFGFLTENSTRASHQFLVFQTPSKMSTKVIRVWYVDVLTLSGIFKGAVNMK